MRRWLSIVLATLLVACAEPFATRNAPLLLAVVDARLRLVYGVSDIPTRQRLMLSLDQLELALRRGDTLSAERIADSLDVALSRYIVRRDGPDVSAILLALRAVTP